MIEEEKFSVGERVVIKGGYGEGRIVTIDRITPTGLIVIGNNTFKRNGRMRGGGSWHSTWIYKLTLERALRIKRAENLGAIASFNLSLLPDADIEAIVTMINKEKEPSK